MRTEYDKILEGAGKVMSGQLFGSTGTLEPGSVFDALVIDNLSDTARKLRPEQIVERFCYIGTKENIKARYLTGEFI